MGSTKGNRLLPNAVIVLALSSRLAEQRKRPSCGAMPLKAYTQGFHSPPVIEEKKPTDSEFSGILWSESSVRVRPPPPALCFLSER